MTPAMAVCAWWVANWESAVEVWLGVLVRVGVKVRVGVRVGVRVSRLGRKSMEMIHVMEDAESGQELAAGTAVLVAYDYHNSRSVPILDEWRQVISDFEKL